MKPLDFPKRLLPVCHVCSEMPGCLKTYVLRVAALVIVAMTPILGCKHQAISDAGGNQLSPKKKWGFRTGKPRFTPPYYPAEASPALAEDGTIYVGGDLGLFAINPDGSQRWLYEPHGSLYEPPGPVTISPVIDDNGSIWIVSGAEEMHRLNPDGHGTRLMGIGVAKQVGVGFDGIVYMGTDRGVFEFDSSYKGTPREIAGEKFALTSDGRMYTTNAEWPLLEGFQLGEKGPTVLWISGGDFPTPTEPAIAADGTVYVTTATQFEAFADNGGGLWSVPANQPTSPCIASDGTIYFGSRDHRLYAVNPDGGLKWMFTTGDAIQSTPAISKAGFIYFGSNDQKLYSVDANGHERWQFVTQGAVYSPTIAPDGTIYVESADGNLYAIEDPQPNGGLNGQWPKLSGGLKNMARRLAQHGD
jgi:outer membrane protein assembly factor BamB